ncbi:hypothetical protein M9H77_07196 [Catharanthus roseus]|uniref:Uncharacterized protein n=1 Tax=Catharanthus roseus TaxID=4058 RepID=A0ACC0BU99_CATRO|nr:hypothetical protein M9H77_07196 [Catharanthus roseus]
MFEKSEEVNFYANDTNFFFASESLRMQNFEDLSKDEDGKLAFKSLKTISFFPSNSYLSFEEFLLIDFETQMGASLKLFKVNPLAFEKSNLRKESLEQTQSIEEIEMNTWIPKTHHPRTLSKLD